MGAVAAAVRGVDTVVGGGDVDHAAADIDGDALKPIIAQ